MQRLVLVALSAILLTACDPVSALTPGHEIGEVVPLKPQAPAGVICNTKDDMQAWLRGDEAKDAMGNTFLVTDGRCHFATPATSVRILGADTITSAKSGSFRVYRVRPVDGPLVEQREGWMWDAYFPKPART